MGESSRTIFERAKEHWEAAEGSQQARSKSHMAKHQDMAHGGEQPSFTMRIVKFHKSALSRQTGEAVRIRRRGGEGAVLNSKGEFNRSFIPRLQLIGEETMKEMEQADVEDQEHTIEELDKLDGKWEQSKTKERAEKARSKGGSNLLNVKRQNGEPQLGGKPSKRYKYELVGNNWGKTTENREAKTTLEPRMVTTLGEGAGTNIDCWEPGLTVDGPGSKDGQGVAHQTPPQQPRTTCQASTPAGKHPLVDGHPFSQITGDGQDGPELPGTIAAAMAVAGETNQIRTLGPSERTVDRLEGGVTIQDSIQKYLIATKNDREDPVIVKNMNDCAEEVRTLQPSMMRNKNVNEESREESMSVGPGVSMSVGMNNKCVISDGICSNGCNIKFIQVTSRRRTQNKKTKLWYDRNVKITKPICIKRQAGTKTVGDKGGSESEMNGI